VVIPTRSFAAEATFSEEQSIIAPGLPMSGDVLFVMAHGAWTYSIAPAGMRKLNRSLHLLLSPFSGNR